MWCVFPMIEAAVVPLFGQWNTIVDCLPVRITRSVGRNALEVTAVSLAADGMIPLRTPHLSWISERGQVAFFTGKKMPLSMARSSAMGWAAFWSAHRCLACFHYRCDPGSGGGAKRCRDRLRGLLRYSILSLSTWLLGIVNGALRPVLLVVLLGLPPLLVTQYKRSSVYVRLSIWIVSGFQYFCSCNANDLSLILFKSS